MLRKNYELQKAKQKVDVQAIENMQKRMEFQEKVIEGKEVLASIESRIEPKDREKSNLRQDLARERSELNELANQQKSLLESLTKEI